jgi:hypothetical protein
MSFTPKCNFDRSVLYSLVVVNAVLIDIQSNRPNKDTGRRVINAPSYCGGCCSIPRPETASFETVLS